MAAEDLLLNIRVNDAALDKLERRLAGSTSGMSKIARGGIVAAKALAAVSVAGIAAGVVVTKLSADYSQELQKIVGLAGVSQRTVDIWGRQMLRLAPQVAKPPQELAEALYFVASSGAPTGKAMDIVTKAAKASAAGLGQTQTIADAVTSAMNAYGAANITAAQATDTLVATVREGKGEAADFATQIGTVVPLAAALHVNFNDVGAALAAMTRLGTPAEMATRQLAYVFQNLLKVTPRAEASFKSVGLSSDQLRKTLSQQGLLAMLQLLEQHFKGNTKAMVAAFPSIQALRGLLALVGKNSGDVAGIFERMRNNTGDLDKAFAAAARGGMFRWHQLMAGIKALAISVGNLIEPLTSKLAALGIVGVGKLQALIDQVGRQRSVGGKVNVVVSALGLGGVTKDFAELTAAARQFGELARRDWPQIRATAEAVFGALKSIIIAVASVLGGVLVGAVKGLSIVLGPLLVILRGIADLLDSRLARALIAGATAAFVAAKAFGLLGAAFQFLKFLIPALAWGMAGLEAELLATDPLLAAVVVTVGLLAAAYVFLKAKADDTAAAERSLSDAIRGVTNAMSESVNADLALKQAHLAVQQAALSVRNAETRLHEDRKSGHATRQQLRQDELDLKQARLQQKQAAQDVADAENRATRSRGAAVDSVKHVGTQLHRLTTDYRATVDAIKAFQFRIGATTNTYLTFRQALRASPEQLKSFESQADKFDQVRRAQDKLSAATAKSHPIISRQAADNAAAATRTENLIRKILGLPPVMQKANKQAETLGKTLKELAKDHKVNVDSRAANSAVTSLTNKLNALNGKHVSVAVILGFQRANTPGSIFPKSFGGGDGVVGASMRSSLRSMRIRVGDGGAGVSPNVRPELALAQSMGLMLTSALRPGAKTMFGDTSLHAVGKAIDVAGSPDQMAAYARAVTRMPGVREVVYSPLGGWYPGSGWQGIGGQLRSQHFNHVHVGVGDGAVGTGGGRYNADDIANRVLQAFDAATTRMLDRIDRWAARLTPAERALRRLQDAATQRDLASGLSSAQSNLSDQQTRLQQLRSRGITGSLLTDQEKAVTDAQQQLADAALAIQENELEKQAAVERAARDKEGERRKKELQARRDEQRGGLDYEINRLLAHRGKTLAEHRRTQREILKLMHSYGVSYAQAGADIGKAFGRAFEREVNRFLGRGLARVKAGANAGSGAARRTGGSGSSGVHPSRRSEHGNTFIVEVNLHGVVGEPEEIARKMTPIIRRELLKTGRRNADLWGGK